MYFEEFGDRETKTIVFLHGAFFTNAFGRQYVLRDRYHLVIPHLMGFGEEAKQTFQTQKQIDLLKDFCSQYEQPAVVGFSLGAQLAFRLISEEPQLFSHALIVSPWLVEKEHIPDSVMAENLKMYHQLQDKRRCNRIARMNGMPREQRNAFVENMQLVTEETVRAAVDNRISFETVRAYCDVKLPILALAGAKESDVVKNSVRKMQEENEFCTSEIWKGAAHNIPPLYWKRFNQKILDFVDF